MVDIEDDYLWLSQGSTSKGVRNHAFKYFHFAFSNWDTLSPSASLSPALISSFSGFDGWCPYLTENVVPYRSIMRLTAGDRWWGFLLLTDNGIVCCWLMMGFPDAGRWWGRLSLIDDGILCRWLITGLPAAGRHPDGIIQLWVTMRYCISLLLCFKFILNVVMERLPIVFISCSLCV